MCGIVGFYSSKSIDESKLIESLVHRGPNSHGFHSYSFENMLVGLGHTRLSILDLSEKGSQPMLDDSNQVVLTFNGEIYNFQELKSTFFNEVNFRSETDTEVILNLYLKFGISFIKKLNGDFAFAILDKRVNKIFLVRDRVGVKPLYYSVKDNELVFASEIKSLFDFGIPREINRSEIQNYFVFKYSPQEKTLIKDVKRLKPGTYLEYDLSSKTHEIVEYWSLKKNPSYEKLSFKEAKKEFSKLMQNSIEIRLLANVPIGNFLSGGIDSSIIAHYVKNKPEIKHYCAVKEEKDLIKEGTSSDGFYAQKLANDWNIKLHQISISSNEASTDLIAKTLFYGDDLIADGSQIPSYLICKDASNQSKVILSGMGADELFQGYAGHQISLISRYLDKLPTVFKNPLLKRFKNLNQGKGKFLSYRRYLHKLGKYGSLGKLKFAYFNIVGDYENALSIYKSSENRTGKILNSYFHNENDVFDNIFKFEYENFLQKNLNYLDRMSMANSIESRVPFLDHRLIEFAYSLPLKYKLSRFGKTKLLLKKVYENILPTYVIKRKKAGFGMPLRSIFSTQDEIDKLLDINFFSNFDGFSAENIEKNIKNQLNGEEDNSALIYALISFQIWCKTHNLK
jgi:asparagine synthase (glutamine-hydrolysing)